MIRFIPTTHKQNRQGSDLKDYKTSDSYQHHCNWVEDRHSIRPSPMTRRERLPAACIFIFSVWPPLKAWKVGKSACTQMPGQNMHSLLSASENWEEKCQNAEGLSDMVGR